MDWNSEVEESDYYDAVAAHSLQLRDVIGQLHLPEIVHATRIAGSLLGEMDDLRVRTMIFFGATGDAEIDDMFHQLRSRLAAYRDAIHDMLRTRTLATDVYKDHPDTFLVNQQMFQTEDTATLNAALHARAIRAAQRQDWERTRTVSTDDPDSDDPDDDPAF